MRTILVKFLEEVKIQKGKYVSDIQIISKVNQYSNTNISQKGIIMNNRNRNMIE